MVLRIKSHGSYHSRFRSRIPVLPVAVLRYEPLEKTMASHVFSAFMWPIDKDVEIFIGGYGFHPNRFIQSLLLE